MDKKIDFYEDRAHNSMGADPEADIRYQATADWIDQSQAITVGELGCGPCRLAKLLQKQNPSIIYKGVDITEHRFPDLTNNDNVDLVVHDANKSLPFANHSLDYLVALEIMEHLENPSLFLTEAKRSLKADGKLILSVPNAYCWNEIWANIKGASDTEGHIGSYHHLNIDALMKFVNMKVESRRGTFTRIPLTKRLFGKRLIIKSNFIFATRSYMYLISMGSGDKS